MSTKHASQKSIYQRGHASDRSRGKLLIATVVILLVAVGAWITVFTRATETTRPAGAPVIDPGQPARAAR